DPVCNGLVDGADVDLLTVFISLSANVRAVGTSEDAHGKLGSSGADQAGNAYHFAAANCQVDVITDLAILVKRVRGVPVADFKDDIPDLGFARREAVRKIASHHAADDAIFGDIVFVTVKGLDGRAIAQDRDRVRHPRDFA